MFIKVGWVPASPFYSRFFFGWTTFFLLSRGQEPSRRRFGGGTFRWSTLNWTSRWKRRFPPLSDAFLLKPTSPQSSTSGQENAVKAKDVLHGYFEKKKEKLGAIVSKYALPRRGLSEHQTQRRRSGKRRHPPAADYRNSSSVTYGRFTMWNPNIQTVGRDSVQLRQVVAGIPDTNDPCFRRYANCIIVNAQPYERRSSISLVRCKSHCLNSQTGVYSCRSFIYDNVNQVCDLFAHVGDQTPARLLKFQSRDYFEPTHAVYCLNFDGTATWPTTTTTQEAVTEVVVTLPTRSSDRAVIHAPKPNRKRELDVIGKSVVVDNLSHEDSKEQPPPMFCVPGKKVSFLRTEGFELFNNDDMTMQVTNVNECITACEMNYVSGHELDCRSFDFISPQCSFSSEAAVPVGNGQLQQRKDSFYYEKICITDNSERNCSPNFARFPQMILVGFAETVIDANSFEACFDNCLDSQKKLGFNCTSGMYFFEEDQLNCILNSEDRHTQSDLFAEENTDIVDYFEIGCYESRPQKQMYSVKTSGVPLTLVGESEMQTEWSKCENGLHYRKRDCNNRKHCSMERRRCNGAKESIKTKNETAIISDNLALPDQIAKVKADVRAYGLRCPPDVCCTVFNRCSVGLKFNTKIKRIEWCKQPCSNQQNQQI